MIRYLPLALLSACAGTTASAPPATPPPNRAIVYETGPCFGTCPVYRVIVGQLIGTSFVGERHVAVSGERRVAAPDAYDRVEALLRPWRATGSVRYAMGEANCPNAPTDMPSARVTWADASGAVTGTLDFYYGCASAQPALAKALRSVPEVLGITTLVGRR